MTHQSDEEASLKGVSHRWISAPACALAAFLCAPAGLIGQTAAGASYDPPKTAFGHPDLQGVWQVLNTAAWDIQDHNASLGVPAGKGVVEGNEIPYQPWALEKKRQNYENRAKLDPEARCLLSGVPRITPQAMRAPELPAGWVRKSSGLACTTTLRPTMFAGPPVSETMSSSTVYSARPRPSALSGGRSPAWRTGAVKCACGMP